MELVGFDPLEDEDVAVLRALVEEHAERTGSPVAARVLDEWDDAAAEVRQGDAARLQARARRARRRERRPSTTTTTIPISSRGEGFVTTETEEPEPAETAA